jgi:hypothetical protein
MCLPSYKARSLEDGGISQIQPDVNLAGLIFALTKSGDHILLFQLDPKVTSGKPGRVHQKNIVRPVGVSQGTN